LGLLLAAGILVVDKKSVSGQSNSEHTSIERASTAIRFEILFLGSIDDN
jgi:hypothetical protein